MIGKNDGLKQLMKNVPSVFVASIDRPKPGQWTLEVSVVDDANQELENPANTDQWMSVRVSGISDVDLLQGFATTPRPTNYDTSTQPIGG